MVEDAIDQDDSTFLESGPSLTEPLIPSPLIPTTPLHEPAESLYDGLALQTSILIKSLYFLDALGSSTWGRFSSIYYNSHGLNPVQIGWIEGVRTVVPTVSQSFWGIVADRCRSRKLVWVCNKFIGTIALLALAAPFVYGSFWNILAVSVGARLFVTNGILDAYTLDLLGTTNKMYYGRYRLYASLSWGVGSIVMGWVTDYFNDFEPNFIMFGALSFLMVGLVAFKIPSQEEVSSTSLEENEERSEVDSLGQTEASQRHIGEILALATRPRVAMFLMEVIIMGAAMATVERLLFLYLVNDLHASTFLCGLSVGVNVLFELPIFWYASPLMNMLGHDGMFLVAMVGFVVRVLGYTLLTPSTKLGILPLEILHGVTFACFWVVTTDISKVLVHQTKGAFWKTAIPSSVQMLYSAVGASVGSVVGGWIMHRYGSRTMYFCTACVVGVTMVVHGLGATFSRQLGYGSSFLPDFADDGATLQADAEQDAAAESSAE